MSWSPQQQAMLSAMGYTLYRPVGLPGASAATAQDVAAAYAGEIAHDRSDRLWQALARAAGGRDPAALAIPPLDQLRASAAAKRALWPALRALRRQR